MRSVDLPEREDVEGQGFRELDELFAEVHRVHCQTGAMLAAIAERVHRTRAYRADGHKSAVAWMRGSRSLSDHDARLTLQTGKMLANLKRVQDAFHDGKVGSSQVHELARAHANPRCGDQLGDVEEMMLEDAQHLPFEDFHQRVEAWKEQADEDGRLDDREWNFKNRRLATAFTRRGFRLEAEGDAARGVEMKEILDHYAAIERQRDWDELVARVGTENARGADLRRSERQRQFDALYEIVSKAASSTPEGTPPVRLANIVIDAATTERWITKLCGGDPGPADPSRYRSYRCSTVDGVALHPLDVIEDLLTGHFRKVMVDDTGLPIKASRTQRLFTGALRAVAQLIATHCMHPGCLTPTSRCQIDHTVPAAAGGLTEWLNSGIREGTHNRWRNFGYDTYRDQQGYWHTLRPDGTEIGPTDWWDSS